MGQSLTFRTCRTTLRLTCSLILTSLVLSNCFIAEAAAPVMGMGKRARVIPGTYSIPIFEKLSDPLSAEMSPDAEQLAEMLGVLGKLHRLVEMIKEASRAPNG